MCTGQVHLGCISIHISWSKSVEPILLRSTGCVFGRNMWWTNQSPISHYFYGAVLCNGGSANYTSEFTSAKTDLFLCKVKTSCAVFLNIIILLFLIFVMLAAAHRVCHKQSVSVLCYLKNTLVMCTYSGVQDTNKTNK